MKSQQAYNKPSRSPYALRSALKTRKNTGEAEEAIAELCVACVEPSTLEEAMSSEDCDKWTVAINKEIKSLQKNNTWILVPRTSEMHVITNRWIFKKKFKSNGEIDKFKARLFSNSRDRL